MLNRALGCVFTILVSFNLVAQPAKDHLLVGPFRHANLSVYLIVGPETDSTEYVHLDEAMKQEILVVYETGDVNLLAVENRSDDKTVFIQAGDIVKGGKQDRVLASDLVVPPRSGRMEIGSFCVESGRWQERGGESAASFSGSNARIASKDMRKAIRGANRSQGEVWENVAKEQEKLAANLSVDVKSADSSTSYQLSLENHALQEQIDAYRQALGQATQNRPDALGMAFLVNGSFSGADVYGSRKLFHDLWPRLLQAAITESIAEQGQDMVAPNHAWSQELFEQMGRKPADQQTVSPRTVIKVAKTDGATVYETLVNAQKRVIHTHWDAQ